MVVPLIAIAVLSAAVIHAVAVVHAITVIQALADVVVYTVVLADALSTASSC